MQKLSKWGRAASLLLFFSAILLLSARCLLAALAGNLRMLLVPGFLRAQWATHLPLTALFLLFSLAAMLLTQRILYARRVSVELRINKAFRDTSLSLPLVPLQWVLSLALSLVAFSLSLFPLLRALDIPDYRAGISLVRTGDEWFDRHASICHALGPGGGRAANSREALLASYAAGQRVFEVDLNSTSDGRVVCVHDWASWNVGLGRADTETAPTAEEFLKTPLQNGCTAMTFSDILLFMEQHPETWFVTDSKQTAEAEVRSMFSDMAAAAENLGLTGLFDRLVIQIYNEGMLETVRGFYDFPHILFTLYQTGNRLNTVGDFCPVAVFCAENGIEGVTMGYWKPEFKAVADCYGLVTFVHTINDGAEAQRLLDEGVQGIYTDILLLHH